MSRYQDKKKKGSAVGTFFTTVLLIASLGVFCYAGYKLYGYYKDYKVGTDEYKELRTNFGSDSDDTVVLGGEDGTVNAPGGETYEPQGNGRSGILLDNIEVLEDPAKKDAEIEKAAAEEVEDDGEMKVLPVLKNPIDFDELQAINEEVIGWIRISGVKIGGEMLSYPIAQGKDNNFYLHRTFKKVDNFAGCIFLNSGNSKFFSDQNSIVYGHNMKNGSMFGLLKNMRDQENYDRHPYFWIFTPKLIYQYRIFSCATVASVGDPYKTRFTTSDFQAFLDKCASASEVDNHGMKLDAAKDRIVTLSTCTGDSSTRFICQGVLEQAYVSK